MLACIVDLNSDFVLQAPKAAENFLALCASGYYDGTLFHRNIKGFMIQVNPDVQLVLPAEMTVQLEKCTVQRVMHAPAVSAKC